MSDDLKARPPSPEPFLKAPGEMAQRMRELDWTKHLLGVPTTWDKNLQVAVGLMLRSVFPQFIAWGPERIFLYNDAYAPILGTAKHPRALGARFEDVWSDIWSDLLPIIEKVDRGESSYFEDLPLVMNRSGFSEQTYFTFSYSPFLDERGLVAGLFCSCTETTARKKFEDALRASERERQIQLDQIEAVIGTMTEGMIFLSPKGELLRMNPEALRQTGFATSADMTKMLEQYRSFISMFYLSGEPVPFEHWPASRVLRGERFSGFEVKLVDSRSEHTWFGSYNGTPVFDANGELVVAVLHVRDITKQRLAFNELETKSAALENSLNGFDIVGADGRLLYVNRAYVEMWGYSSASEVIGMSAAEHCADPTVPLQIITALKATGECNIEFKALRKDKSTFDVRMWARLAYDADGNEIYPTTSVDVSAQKKYELDLQSAKEEAERANLLKSVFLANMSHEIRTPLGAMLGFADLLKDANATMTERSNYVDILTRNGENLSVIINDILDLSKVEAGHLAHEYHKVNPAQVAEEVMSLLRIKGKEKDLVLELELSPSAYEIIVTDPVRLRQILTNLVGNSIKFTRHGSVKVRVGARKSESGEKMVSFEVEDTGIGIAEEHFEKIFGMFIQADNSMTRKFGGTGLGLALSKRLAVALGGDVTILKSQLAKGTTFLVEVLDQPESLITKVADEASAKSLPSDLGPDVLKDKRILVVDDAPDNRHLLWRILTKRGAVVESAENGFEGYRKALAEPFDIVLMDIQMPQMDGYTATQKLRSAGFDKPIVALTAHAMSEVRRKCLNVGCTDHLTKPINTAELVATIVKLTTGP